MKIPILICLCIGSALALPSTEVPTLPPISRTVAVEHHPSTEINPAPVRAVEQLAPEVQLDDGAKESLEPAASAWGHGYRGWGGYGGGYGGGYYRSYGGYGGYGGWGGYRSYPRYYGGYGSYW